MIKMRNKFLAAVSILFFGLTAPACAATPIRIALQPTLECFPVWYAMEKGWDKEEGLDFDLLLFDSGMGILNALPAKEWHVGISGTGLLGGLRYGTYLIANAINEFETIGILVRPNSPILSTQGFNPGFPDVYGKPEDIKGKLALVTTVSTAHFLLDRWLNCFGMTDKDLIVNNMEQAHILTAFENNIGDIVGVWVPYLQFGIDKGWKLVATGKDTKTSIITWVICEKGFGDEHSDLVSKFLRAFIRGTIMLRDKSPVDMIDDYKRFLLDFCGISMSDEQILSQLKLANTYNLEEQLSMFDESSGMSEAQRNLTQFGEFMVKTDRLSQDELDSIKGMKFATDKFLKMVKTPIPGY